MALNSSGPISLGGSTAGQSVNLELGQSATAQISFNDANVRTLTGTTAGTALIMPTNFYGKSSRATASYTFSASTANASLNVTSLSGYSAGKTDITITINSGIYLYSTTFGTAGLTLTGGTTGDTITLVNNGYIMGLGGNGDIYNSSNALTTAATAGSLALSLGFNTTVTNTSGYIGGGGGAGGTFLYGFEAAMGGGGAGGGNAAYIAGGPSPGVGGSIGNAGTNGSGGAVGGGGGRILPGTGGAGGVLPNVNPQTATAFGYGGGSGGGGAGYASYNGGKPSWSVSSGGGGGGGWGASGGTAKSDGNNAGYAYGGSGGSAGATGGDGYVPTPTSTTAGTAGGKAVALNGYTITWTGGSSSSSRAYGAVS